MSQRTQFDGSNPFSRAALAKVRISASLIVATQTPQPAAPARTVLVDMSSWHEYSPCSACCQFTRRIRIAKPQGVFGQQNHRRLACPARCCFSAVK